MTVAIDLAPALGGDVQRAEEIDIPHGQIPSVSGRR
jgi:hypothetical protein